MRLKDKLILLYEINFVHDSTQVLKERKIGELPAAIEALEKRVDRLWQTIERLAVGAREAHYEAQIKEQRFYKGMKLTIVPAERPENKAEKQAAYDSVNRGRKTRNGKKSSSSS